MSGLASTELNAALVIEQIESGAYSLDVVGTTARGFMPLEQDDLVAVLAYLHGYPNAEIAALARATMSELPPRAVLSFANNENAAPSQLAALLLAKSDSPVLGALIRNRAVTDESIAELAGR